VAARVGGFANAAKYKNPHRLTKLLPVNLSPQLAGDGSPSHLARSAQIPCNSFVEQTDARVLAKLALFVTPSGEPNEKAPCHSILTQGANFLWEGLSA
jgi:hypothetical protein